MEHSGERMRNKKKKRRHQLELLLGNALFNYLTTKRFINQFI